jgi:ABC-2 type transport system ATP-binding protein
MAEPVLVEVERVTRVFGARAVVKDVSFAVRQGEVLGFLGPNGAGKTTTMRMLTGTLAPSAGRVSVGGVDLLAQPLRAKAQLGYLPEQPPLARELRVDEYLDFCARLHRVPRGRVRTAREQAKARCGLAEVGRRLIGNLSKGYQQRVGIAQAIVHEPRVVILDEPTVGLDPLQIQEIRALIRELGRHHSVILSTHILAEVQAVCSHVQIIRDGELVLRSSIGELGSHLGGTRLEVALRRPPPPDALASLPGVTGVAPGGSADRFVLAYTNGQDPTDALVRRAVEADWGLYELRPPQLSLERVFLELAGAQAQIP